MNRSPFRIAAVLAASALVLSACGSDDSTDSGAGGGDDAAASEGGGGSTDGVTIGIKFDQPGLGQMDGDTPLVWTSTSPRQLSKPSA